MKAEEIVGQVIHFARILYDKGQHVSNIVFMGMGEPLANYSETIRAVQLLTHPRGFWDRSEKHYNFNHWNHFLELIV